MSQDPLDSLVLQKRHYLETQENQIQRNVQLLSKHQRQLKLNKAKLSQQDAKLKSLTKDAQTVLESLKKQAEAEPSQRHLELTKACAELQRELTILKRQKKSIEDALSESSLVLEKLDAEIIEADAIYKDLEEQLADSRKRLQASNRRASFQARIVTDLEYDLGQAEKKLEQTHRLKLALEADQDKIAKDITAKQQQSKYLVEEISERTEKLETINLNIASVSKSLEALVKRDKDFRGRLAQEKQALEREKENIKVSKEALKQDTMVRQQLNPKWKPRNTGEPAHFKL